jgi:acyl-CoA reductase-like NAD-dependent aldehyde dehydrogenase
LTIVFPRTVAGVFFQEGKAALAAFTAVSTNADNLARLETIAMGQTISLAKRMILASAGVWRYYAGYAGKVGGEAYPPDGDGTYKIVFSLDLRTKVFPAAMAGAIFHADST